jgi:hypothetical protein
VDIATGQTAWRWELGEYAGLRLMPDGARFLELAYPDAKMRRVSDGQMSWRIDECSPNGGVTISPDGTRLTSVDHRRGGVRMHDAASGKVVWQFLDAEPLAFSADGRTLWARSKRERQVLALASADGAIQTRIDRQGEDTIGFHPSPDGKRAIARSFPTASGYDLQTGKRLWHASGSDLWFAILPDGEAFVSESTTLRLRSMATGLDLAPPFELRKRIPDIPLRVVLLPDGRTLLIADNEGLVFKFGVERP